MSKCHVCGVVGSAVVLVKVQWFGRGTKWLCLECVRVGIVQPPVRGTGDAGQETVILQPVREGRRG